MNIPPQSLPAYKLLWVVLQDKVTVSYKDTVVSNYSVIRSRGHSNRGKLPGFKKILPLYQSAAALGTLLKNSFDKPYVNHLDLFWIHSAVQGRGLTHIMPYAFISRAYTGQLSRYNIVKITNTYIKEFPESHLNILSQGPCSRALSLFTLDTNKPLPLRFSLLTIFQNAP